MTTLADIIDGAKFRADLIGSDRVSDAQWTALANESITHAWRLAAQVRPDFQFASQDFVVASGTSASFALPADFFDLIDVVYAPETTSEYSLGPFAWQNRRSPGGWMPSGLFSGIATGGSSCRMMGGAIYIEPATRAGGTYRLWYCPKPTTLLLPTYTVRLASVTGSDIMSGAYTAAGIGPAHVLTSTSGATLFVDVAVPSLGDRILLKDATVGVNNGIYQVTQLGGGPPWKLTRTSDFDSNAEIRLGQTVYVSEGTFGAGLTWRVSTFSDLDTNTVIFALTPTTVLDPILDPFVELLKIKTALPAVVRDDDLDPRALQTDLTTQESALQTYFRTVRNSNGPQKTVDTDARGPRGWGVW